MHITQYATEASKDKFQACFEMHHDIPFAHITVHHDMLGSSLHIVLHVSLAFLCDAHFGKYDEVCNSKHAKSNIGEIQGLRHNMAKAECIVPTTFVRI